MSNHEHSIHFFVGLGNPGSEYKGTRHNLGFEVIDAVAKKLNIAMSMGEGDYLVGFGTHGETKVGLLKPLTYMNNSGSAVADIRSRYTPPLDKLLVICDDFQLPLGSLRLRSRGSDGGHNGLYSIIYHLQSDEFPRLRLGIAGESIPSSKSFMADYVLSPFSEKEKETVQTMVARASDAALAVLDHGFENAMNQFNRKLS